MNLDAAIRTVRSGLELYGFGETAALELVKYRENYVFRLTAGTGEGYAVRLHRAGYRQDAEIRTEMAYLHALAGRGLSVPEPVPALDGGLMSTVTAEDGTVFQLDVLRWIEGAHPLGDITEALAGESSLGPEVFRKLGVLAAELHNLTSAIGRLPGFQRRAWDADGLAGPAPLWGDPLAIAELDPDAAALLAKAAARLRRDLEALGTAPEGYGVIHADLTPENILVQDGRLVMIDFDDFGEGWHLFDLATVLFFYQPHPQYGAYFEALTEGYSSVRPLPGGFPEAFNAMLLARGLTYLGWAGERRGDEAAEYIVGHVVPLVLGLADRYTSAAVFPAGS